jgi:ureidoglycolate lyase
MATHDADVVVTIPAEMASVDGFAPFGELLTTIGEPTPHVYGDALAPYRAGRLRSDAEVEWIITTYHLREFRVQYLERHHNITQTFIPLGGDAMVVAVARPDATLTNGVPDLQEVRAFVVPGTMAVNLHLGTWHEVPFPTVEGQTTLLTSHSGVTTGWASLDESGEIDRPEADEEKRDVLERTGVRLMIDAAALA